MKNRHRTCHIKTLPQIAVSIGINFRNDHLILGVLEYVRKLLINRCKVFAGESGKNIILYTNDHTYNVSIYRQHGMTTMVRKTQPTCQCTNSRAIIQEQVSQHPQFRQNSQGSDQSHWLPIRH